jgi:hypothetical protein
MRRLTVAAFLAALLVVGYPTKAEAHTIRCATYVGNEDCFHRAYVHGWWHRILSNPLGLGR